VLPGRRRHGDDDDARERDRQAHPEGGREALPEERSRQHGHDDRGDVDDEGRRPGVEVAFGRVDRHRVEPEPERAVGTDERQRAPPRDPHRTSDGDQRQRHGAHPEPAEGHRAGRVVRPGGSDDDERGGPQQHGHECGQQGEGGSTVHGTSLRPTNR
jgi:hypothetical protein